MRAVAYYDVHFSQATDRPGAAWREREETEVKTITWQEYSDSKTDFYRRHGEYIEHSVLGEDGVNRKSVGFLDGANWYEVAETVTETEIIERHGIRTAVEIKYRRVEIWDTENSRSRYLYTRESRRACKIAA